jgi:predicted PurR-regulated permease PerM
MGATGTGTNSSPVAAAPPSGAVGDDRERRLRRLVLLFLAILGGAAVLWLAWQVVGRLAHVLVLLLAAVLLAFLLAAPVERLERRLPRPAAVGLVFAGVLLALAAGLVLLVGPLVSQLGGLLERLPERAQALQDQQADLERFLSARNLPIRLADLRQQALDRAAGMATGLIEAAPALLGGVAGLFVDIVVALALTFYLLLDGPRLRHGLLRLTPARWRAWAFVVEAAMRKVVGGYLRGQLLVALLIGASAGVGCWLLGAPFPVVIGVLAGVLELVPMLGPILATVAAVAITAPQGFPQVLWVLLLFIGIHQVELNVLAPRIAGHAVGLHPAGALVALLVGFELGGALGGLVAVPTAGVVAVLAQAIDWERSGQPAPAPPPRPDRLGGLARRLAGRRQASHAGVGAAGQTAAAPVATVTTTTTVSARGEGAEQPEALVKLAEEAQQLHVAFDAAERARLAARHDAGAAPAPGDDPPRQG